MKTKTSVLKKLKASKPKQWTNKNPLWKGPVEDGITRSMLALFLVCRERFRIKYILGLQPHDKWNHRIGYGDMWHECEETLLEGGDWYTRLQLFASNLIQEYPTQRNEIEKWFNVCKRQFEVYLEHWDNIKSMKRSGFEVLGQEVEFNFLYDDYILLRGKIDGVLWNSKTSTLVIQENKTKGDIDEESLRQQLSFDLQTMTYLTAAINIYSELKPKKFGVLYNVIRRPLSGGKYSISQLQNVNRGKKGANGKPLPKREETNTEYYDRLQGLIREDSKFFFCRWDVEVEKQDIDKFKKECLSPILEELAHWYEDIIHGENSGHWRTPYGLYNPMAEGRMGDVDNFLNTGNTAGLKRVDRLFPELKEEKR